MRPRTKHILRTTAQLSAVVATSLLLSLVIIVLTTAGITAWHDWRGT